MKRWAALLIVPALVVAGCGGGGTSSTSGLPGAGSGGSGGGGGGAPAPTLVLRATDAPFPIASVIEANVFIDRIDIRPVGGSFQTLIDYGTPEKVDLITLQNGATQTLVAASPAPGSYDALRLVLVGADITIDDNGTPVTFPDLKVPSGQQTGIKLFVDFEVVTQLTADLLLDFDLSRSFVVQGNPSTPAGIKGFLFKPVIRAVNISTAGSVTAIVLSDNGTPGDAGDDFELDGAQVDLTSQATLTTTTGFTGVDPNDPLQHGFFLQPGLLAGDYDVEVSATDHASETTTASVVVANLTDLGTITLEAVQGVIRGVVTTVITSTSGTPLSFAIDGATVTGTPMSGGTALTDTTNTFGQYELAGAAFESHDLEVVKAGFDPATGSAQPVPAANPSAPSFDLVLAPLTATVTGTVATSTTPVVGATVRATVDFGGTPHVIAEATTQADGSYDLGPLPTADYTIEVDDSAGATGVTKSQPLSVLGGGPTLTVDFDLSVP